MRVVIAGYGNVGRELGILLAEKVPDLRQRYGLEIMVAGVVTGRHGGWVARSATGIAPAALVAADWPSNQALPEGAEPFSGDALALIQATLLQSSVPADVLIEISPTNPRTGEPALSYCRAAIAHGMHVVTANKGPIALAHRELQSAAAARGVKVRFESTVMDGTPVINLSEFTLPATEISGIRAIINATSNYILSGLTLGQDFAETVRRAQAIGIAEADPSLDLDGWDAAVKVTIIANVLMGAAILPSEVVRETDAERMRAMVAAAPAGHVIKQVASVVRDSSAASGIRARVALEELAIDDSLASIGQGKAAIQFHTDTMGDLTVIEGPGSPRQTAFGILADLITIHRQSTGMPEKEAQA